MNDISVIKFILMFVISMAISHIAYGQRVTKFNTQGQQNSSGKPARDEGRILNGAIYDSDGNVLCVLPDGEPGTFLWTGVLKFEPYYCETIQNAIKAGAQLDKMVQTLTSSPFSVAQVAPIRRIGKLTNDNLLKRLIWISAEGGCWPVTRVCNVAKGKGCYSPSASQYGSMYFAYVLHNRRDKSYKNDADDDRMIREGCKDASGKKYDQYFIPRSAKGGNADPVLYVALDPSQWVSNPLPPGLPLCQDKKCEATRVVARCLKDIIDVEIGNLTYPFTGTPQYWVGDFEYFKLKDVLGPNCKNKSMARILVRSQFIQYHGNFVHCFH